MTEEVNNEVNFGLEDLQIVAKIIAATQQRGAIRAEEMVTVGNLYTKVMAILESANAVPQEVQEESNTEQEESND